MTTTDTPAETLSDLVDAITDKQVKAQLAKLDRGFDERAAFEALNNPANTSIQDKLKGYRKKLLVPGIAAMTLAAKVNPDFMNHSAGTGANRFNVYAIDKVADLLHGLNAGTIRNAVNRAIVQSLFRFETAGVPFTGAAAQGAASQNLKVEKAIEGLLVRHTVSPTTAPTQASSTMNALLVIGAVRNVGSAKYPSYQLVPGPVTERLREVA